jgi:hypothetical protein
MEAVSLLISMVYEVVHHVLYLEGLPMAAAAAALRMAWACVWQPTLQAQVVTEDFLGCGGQGTVRLVRYHGHQHALKVSEPSVEACQSSFPALQACSLLHSPELVQKSVMLLLCPDLVL